MVVGSMDSEVRLPKVRPRFCPRVIYKRISSPGLPVEVGGARFSKQTNRKDIQLGVNFR